MAAGGGGLAVRVWKQWGIQILVVASFLLQLVLLVFGGFRRRSSSSLLLGFLWLSYLMADNIAVYALGHMSLESRPRDDDGLVAFWATFFLLHLGGQDTITAFSLEDNQLWKRHLLTLLVQASGAGYAIYRYTIPGTWTLVSATIVMFVVGFLKYGERVWALQRGSSDTFDLMQPPHSLTQERVDMLKSRDKMDREEEIVLDSHYMFHFCKGAFSNVSRQLRLMVTSRDYFTEVGLPLPYTCDAYIYDLVEAELSLLYDLFYTKVQVVHTWQGYLIRVISLVGTVSAFLLFRLGDKGAYSRVDVSITYLLLVGAIILETTSVCSVLGSTWTCECLHRRGWNRTNAIVMHLRRLFKVGNQRRWLHSVGQHNVMDYCCRNRSNAIVMHLHRLSNVLEHCRRERIKYTNMIMEATVPRKWFRMVNFSRNTPITVEFKKLVFDQILTIMTDSSSIWNIYDAQGQAVLRQYDISDGFLNYAQESDFADKIVIWQVATEIFLHNRQHRSGSTNTEDDEKPLVEAIKVLSNYLGFLMLQPSLVPGGVRTNSTAQLYSWRARNHKNGFRDAFGGALEDKNHFSVDYKHLADQMILHENVVPMLRVVFGVWVEFLCHAAHHSTPISHCRQLGRGGEFLTVIRLVIDHVELVKCYNETVARAVSSSL